MERNLFLSLLVILTCAGMVACGGEVPPLPEDEKGDACTGDACLADVDGTGGEADVQPSETKDQDVVVPPDEISPDLDVLCDECEVGQIKCDGNKKYRECVEKDGCWKWSGQPVVCKVEAEVCACNQIDGSEGVCKLDDVGGKGCACIPDCEGEGGKKECGPDGCGGECGKCEDPKKPYCSLLDFTCVEEACGECAEGETLCNGPKVKHCIDIAEGEGQPCWVFGDDEDCPDFQTCVGFECACDFKQCGEGESMECCAGNDYVCLGDSCCKPDCEGKECGDDGCGGNCGKCATTGCPGDKPYICVEGQCDCDCPVKECNEGEQVCQGKTGYKKCTKVADTEDCWVWKVFGCPAGKQCNEKTGKCECVPKCTGFECGPDGCGGTCGTCPAGWTCQPNQKCLCDCSGIPENPVCDLPNKKTYKNACSAECDGVFDFVKGACPTCQDNCTADEKKPMELCGEDGKTYASFCALKCTIGASDCTAVGKCGQIKYVGACKLDCCKDKNCPQVYNPICGTDAVTYCNMCSLQLCPKNPGADYACLGECKDKVKCASCEDKCQPVCGLLGEKRKTYGNECLMKCQGAKKLWDGDCCMTCPDVDAWICTSEYKALKSECFMLCLPPDDDTKLFDVPKKPDGTFWVDVCEKCKCDLSKPAPVCGDNYFTYATGCALECANAEAPDKVGLLPLCQDKCGFDTCPCPVATGGQPVAAEAKDPPDEADNLKRGVCGADGNTYGNKCSAAYFKTTVVSETWCNSCQEACAGMAYEPVCCKDGVTYSSSCLPEKCNSNLIPAECSKGKCCKKDADCDDGKPETTDKCGTKGVCENL